MDVPIECIHELTDAPALPVAPVEELDLEPPEEPFHGGVVRRAALLRHGARDPVTLTALDPAGPAVVAAPVAVAYRALAFCEPGCSGVEHRVHQLGVGGRRLRPCHAQAVEAVDDGAQVRLAGRDGELRDVREPERVGLFRMEVSVHDVGGRVADLAFVGAVLPFHRALGDEPRLFHDSADDLLRYHDFLRFERGMHPSVAVTAVVLVEDLRYADAQVGVLVRSRQGASLVAVAAFRHPHRIEQNVEFARRPQALNKDRLLPVGEHLRVGASVFSQQLHRPFQDRAPKLEPAYVAAQGSGALLELFDGPAIRLSRHLAGHLLVQKPSLPIVEGGPLDAELVRYIFCGPRPGHEIDHGLFLYLVGDFRRRGAPAPLARLKLLYPGSEQLLGRVAERSQSARKALPMLEEVVDGDALLLVGVSPALALRRDVAPVFEVFVIPGVQSRSSWVPQLSYDRCGTHVVLDEQLGGPDLLFP